MNIYNILCDIVYAVPLTSFSLLMQYVKYEEGGVILIVMNFALGMFIAALLESALRKDLKIEQEQSFLERKPEVFIYILKKINKNQADLKYQVNYRKFRKLLDEERRRAGKN